MGDREAEKDSCQTDYRTSSLYRGKSSVYPSWEGTEAGCIGISQAGTRQLKQAYRHMQMVFQMPAGLLILEGHLETGGESLRNMGIKGTELKTKGG